MKSAKIESKKIAKVAKTRRVAGVQVRSGVKAGGIPGAHGGGGGIHGGGGGIHGGHL